MSGISRKELKQDQFVAEVTKTVDYVQSHRERLMTVGGAVLAILVVVAASYLVYQRRSDNANDSLGAAMRTFNAPVQVTAVAADPNQRSFKSDKEKYEAALQEFRATADKYSWLAPGKMSRYYAGICLLNLARYDEAEKELGPLAGSGNELVASLSKFALAGAKASAGKTAEAEQLYRQLADKPSGAISKITAQLALAAALAESKPAEAVKIYDEIEASKPSPDVSDQVRKGRAALGK